MPHASGRRSTGAVNFQPTRAVCRISVSCSMFHLGRDRSRVDLRVVRSCQRRSEVLRQQANDVTWPAVACVFKSMKLGMHMQLLNMLKQRSRNWFFREEVDFLSSLAFVVN